MSSGMVGWSLKCGNVRYITDMSDKMVGWPSDQAGLCKIFCLFAEYFVYYIMEKICSRCKLPKLIKEFRPNNSKSDGLQHCCISCDKEYQKEWYQKNKKSVITKTRILNKEIQKINRAFIVEYLKNNPCVECGEKDIVVLQFDHIGHKTKGVSLLIKSSTLLKIKEEISRCQVLCANCHTRKTAKQFGWYKLD